MKWVCAVFLALVGTFAAECPTPELSAQEGQTRFHELDRRAQVEFRRGEFAKAAEDFRLAACFVPSSGHPYYDLYGAGAAAVAVGDFARAREALEEADRQRQEYPLPLAMLVKISLAAGDMGYLKKSLLAAARRFPEDSRLHADLAQDLVHEKKYDLALAEALRLERSGVMDAKATINLAVLENQVGALGDAIRHAVSIEQQAELSGRVRASGAGVAGLSYEGIGQAQEAVPHLQLAIRLAPDEETPYLALARIYQQQQNYSAAVKVLEQARQQIPGSPNLLLALGSGLVLAEQYATAAQILQRLIQDFPEQFEAYAKLAEAYRDSGEPRLATQTLRKLIERRPDYPMLHVAVAQSMLEEDPADYPGILEELVHAEKASPADYDVHYLRGRAYLSMKKYEQAVVAFRQAIELRPTEPGGYYQLGLVYRKLGKTALAKEQFQRVEYLKSEPSAVKVRK